ncbi:MAG: hypothetical protein Q8R33_19485 [Burkholderiales bacterium]|nr:hypothetical protein [Burkholderiales bacterium]
MSSWITTNPIAYPALEVVHITGIALLVGNLVLVELRVWGLGRTLPLPALARLGLTVSVIGFGLAAASGLLMFASQAAELMANRAFVLKMGLLTLAGANAGLFHARDGLTRLDTLARLQTALSLGLWLGVIICGRWIAYR